MAAVTGPLPEVVSHPLAPLAEEAEARLRHRPAYARPLAAGGGRGRAIAEAFDRARACLGALARPRSASLRLGPVGLGRLPPLPLPPGRPAIVAACLMTLGHDQAEALAWLDGDYLAHHVQTELSRETLFALGRRLRRAGLETAPAGSTSRKLALLSAAEEGGPRRWDGAAVGRLLAAFGTADLGVQALASGCFSPLHTLLSLTLSSAAESPAPAAARAA